MSERRKIIRNIATTAVALGVAATAAGEIQAKSAPVSRGTRAEAFGGHEQRKSLEQLTADTVAKLKSGQTVQFYYGTLKIFDRNDPTKIKFAIENPIVVPVTDNIKHPNRVASTEYAIGNWDGNHLPSSGDPGNVGAGYKLQLFSYRKGMEFKPYPRSFSGEPKVLNEVKYSSRSYGLDIYNPLKPDGSSWLNPNFKENFPLGIGNGIRIG